MPTSVRRTVPKRPAVTGIRDLLSYRISRAANLISRSAALRYRREFDVTLGEWRALALLAADAPLSLNQLARAAGLDKAQMSRVVAGLIERGLVLRELSDRGGRAVALTMTRRGTELYEGLIAAAAERDAAFRGCLSPEELEALESALNKLTMEARRQIRAEAGKADDLAES